jgi:hypothetical protein
MGRTTHHYGVPPPEIANAGLGDTAIALQQILRRSEIRGCAGNIRPHGRNSTIDRRCRSSKPIPVSLGEQESQIPAAESVSQISDADIREQMP